MTRLVAMQPTYLPWIGYFALIDLADVFVFLDDVQFDRRSWQQRNKIKGHSGEMLLTVPVDKAPRDTPIYDITVNYEQDFPRRHIASIEHHYRAAPHFEVYWEALKDVLRSAPARLAELNIQLIELLTEQLEIATAPYARSSVLAASGQKDEYLANICDEFSASEYLSPMGSLSYLEGSTAFAKRNIPVRYLDFEHPTYRQQHGHFKTHLSVVDLLFNEGPQALNIIRSGYRNFTA